MNRKPNIPSLAMMRRRGRQIRLPSSRGEITRSRGRARARTSHWTGVFWKSVQRALAAAGVDVSDSQWLATLTRYGLVRGVDCR